MVEIINAEALEQRFGAWPSFHDAEVLGLHLDSGQRSDGVTRLRLEVHLFGVGERLSTGRMRFHTHTVATFEFEEVEAVELEGWGPQNVLDDLLLEEVNLAAGRQLQVTLPANNGVDGTFRCRSVTVLAVEPFEPGEHSVYGSGRGGS